MTAFERKLPPQPGELPATRAALKEWLNEVGINEKDATADVLVVSSELVTNGVFHDGGDLITLRAERQDRDVSIEVTTVDHEPGHHPTYRDVEDSAEGGRGLDIVQALSHDYSVVRHDHERVTACRVTTSAEDATPVAAAETAFPPTSTGRGSAAGPKKKESRPRQPSPTPDPPPATRQAHETA